MEEQIVIRPVRENDLELLRDAINNACLERRYLATIDGFSREQIREFLNRVIENSLPQVVAEIDGRIIGWCDIIPEVKPGFTHVGHLGMGVCKEYRQKGVGRHLLNDCLSLARKIGLEKVELEVFADNYPAIQLYESLGFEDEGCKKRARKLDGQYQDIRLMAMMLE